MEIIDHYYSSWESPKGITGLYKVFNVLPALQINENRNFNSNNAHSLMLPTWHSLSLSVSLSAPIPFPPLLAPYLSLLTCFLYSFFPPTNCARHLIHSRHPWLLKWSKEGKRYQESTHSDFNNVSTMQAQIQDRIPRLLKVA